MLFDLQGKRKRLIQVIYALLALLMGGGLVLLGIGGEVSGGLLDAFTNRNGAQTSDLVKEADRLQEKVDAEPNNKQAMTKLIRARYTAGNAAFEFTDDGQTRMTSEAREQFELAAETWRQYLEQDPDPVDANVAQLVANALFGLAQNATDGISARINAAAAADAQAYFAEARPSVGSYSTLAIYSFFGDDFERGDEAVEKVLELSKTPAAKKRNERQLKQYRKQAKDFQKQLEAFQEASKAGKEGETEGPPQILSPSGGLTGGN